MVSMFELQMWMNENNGSILRDPLHPEVFTGYVTFTPERAKRALENNIKNRKIKAEYQIPVLKESIESGNWNDNVSKINFDRNGILSDGQHRLTSCVLTGKTIRCLVTYGVDELAQIATDRRGARTLSDDLEIHGWKQAKALAVVTKIDYYLGNGLEPKDLIIASRKSKNNAASDLTLYRHFIQNSDRIVKSWSTVAMARRRTKEMKINPNVINVLAIVFDDISKTDAMAFWDKMYRGISSQENDPVLQLRRQLIKNAESKTKSIPPVIQAALIIKAWNLFESGETTEQLKFRAGGASPEEFPKIYDPYKESSV